MGQREALNRLTLGPGEAARALGVSENTLRRWMREERLPYARVGGRILIRVDRLLDWIDVHQEDHAQELEMILALAGSTGSGV